MFTTADFEAAAAVVHAAMPPTPQYAWPLLAARTGCETWVKHENHTPTGAFKVRGGLHYCSRLKDGAGAGKDGAGAGKDGAGAVARDTAGLISATRGNHGQSIAFAGRRHGFAVTILVPHGNSVEKNAAMKALGADLIEHGRDFDEAKDEAYRLARERKLVIVPPFHRDLVLGVGTYALELFRAVPGLHTVYAPIGMGSGICGVIGARDALGLATKVVGVQSDKAPSYARSFAAGRLVTTETSDTIADGMATRVPDPQAFETIKRGAERIVTVSDDEVVEAIRAYYTDTHNLAEGAGAAPLAALMKERDLMRGKKVGLILSGGNIDLSLFLRIVR